MSVQSDLAAAAKCYCFEPKMAGALWIYLLAKKANLLTMTPTQLAAAAKCYCFDDGTQKKIVAYLLEQISAQGQTPAQLAAAAKCFCFDEQTQRNVVAYLLDVISGGSTPGGCPQDMQVAWTPTNLKLGEMFGLYAQSAPIPLNGILTLTITQATNEQGYFIAGGVNTLESISFPNLVTISALGANGFGLQCRQSSSLTSISAPLLTTIYSINGLWIYSNTSLTSINFPTLSDVNGGIIDGDGDTALGSISFPALINATQGIDFSFCTVLTTVSLPVYLPANGSLVNFQSCALSVASVNHILARCVANAAYVSGTVNLNGQTPAAPPSGQGIADKATLIGRGVVVNTD